MIAITLSLSIGTYALLIAAIGVIVAAIAVTVESQTHAISDTINKIKDEQSDWKNDVENAIASYVAILKFVNKYDSEERHHIVAKTDRRAYLARLILKECDININSHQNLVYVDKTYHKVLHTNMYYFTLTRNLFLGYALFGEKGVKTTLLAYQTILGALGG